MKLAIFPNHRFLRFGFVLFSFLLSIWGYYALQPQIESFSEIYRWEQFGGFVRLWIGVFWVFLALIMTMDTFQKSNEAKEFGDGFRGDARFVLIPVLLLLYPIWGLGIELGKNDSFFELITNSTKEFGFLVGGIVLLLAALEFRAYCYRRKTHIKSVQTKSASRRLNSKASATK